MPEVISDSDSVALVFTEIGITSTRANVPELLVIYGVHSHRAFFINNGRSFRRILKQRLGEIYLLWRQVLLVGKPERDTHALTH